MYTMIPGPGRQHGKRHKIISTLITWLALGIGLDVTPGLCMPQEGQVTAGSASIRESNGQRMDISQTSDRAILDWNSFNIGQGESVHFQQPSTSSIILNRIHGQDPSQIYGSLTANGNVGLINRNGILFHKGSQVDVGGLVATTSWIGTEDFMSGNDRFQATAHLGDASVINRGIIHVRDGGMVVLAGPKVENSGVIQARLGSVTLAAGEAFSVDFNGDGLLSFAMTPEDSKQLKQQLSVNNQGKILADGGQVRLTTAAAGDVVDRVVHMGGEVEAKTVSFRQGRILLGGGHETVTVSGKAEASGIEGGQSGGSVDVLGRTVALQSTARIDVSGDAGGGTIRVGGDFQGRNTAVANAARTRVDQGAVLKADAVTKGQGGPVTVWSDGVTRYRGSISSRGGLVGGDGGQVEVSGKQRLEFSGSVDARAPQGTMGRLWLDPTNIVVATAGTDSVVTNVDNFADADQNGGTSTSTISPAVLNAAAASVTLQATNNITFTDAVSLTTNGANLTAQAGNNITVNNTLTTQAGNITLSANDSGGPASGSGAVDINANITTNGGGFTSSGVNFESSGATISTAGGAVALTHTGTVALGAVTTTSTLNVTSSGSLTQTGALTVSGITTLAAGNGNTITLDNTSNNFSGAVTVSNGGNITLTDANHIVLGSGSMTGTLKVTAVDGSITQNGALTVPGTTTLSASGTSNGITLDNTSNNFSGAVIIASAGNVSLADANDIILGAGTLSGTLGVTAVNGSITQSGALTVPGVATFSASGTSNGITLSNTSNNFSSAVIIASAGNVSLADSNDIILGTGTLSGTLSVTAVNGSITQSGALTVPGTTALSASGTSNGITLDNTSNNFSG
ncbi:MAG: putative Filamentous hemagglutinin family N-terminal domain protein, partial [Magnetococcales bacterium]|nr:putative Filamentous hemagglutinin family N-terminal domain protein [Magnetococcales bacterium]